MHSNKGKKDLWKLPALMPPPGAAATAQQVQPVLQDHHAAHRISTLELQVADLTIKLDSLAQQLDQITPPEHASGSSEQWWYETDVSDFQ